MYMHAVCFIHLTSNPNPKSSKAKSRTPPIRCDAVLRVCPASYQHVKDQCQNCIMVAQALRYNAGGIKENERTGGS